MDNPLNYLFLVLLNSLSSWPHHPHAAVPQRFRKLLWRVRNLPHANWIHAGKYWWWWPDPCGRGTELHRRAAVSVGRGKSAHIDTGGHSGFDELYIPIIYVGLLNDYHHDDALCLWWCITSIIIAWLDFSPQAAYFWVRRVRELTAPVTHLLGVKSVWCETKAENNSQKFVLWAGFLLEKKYGNISEQHLPNSKFLPIWIYHHAATHHAATINNDIKP